MPRLRLDFNNQKGQTMSDDFWLQELPPIILIRNHDKSIWCKYCKERYGKYKDKDTGAMVWHWKAQAPAYYLTESIHPQRKGRRGAYCLPCVNEIEADGYSLQDQLIFGATYTHKISTDGDNKSL